jgi:hypothetical protein
MECGQILNAAFLRISSIGILRAMIEGAALNSPSIASTRFGNYGRIAPSLDGFFLWGEESRISNRSIKVGGVVHIRERPNYNRNVTKLLDHPKNLLQNLCHLDHGAGGVHGAPSGVAGSRSLENKEVAMTVEASDAWMSQVQRN